MTEMVPVAGFCPMGCGKTLFLGEGGAVTCSYGDCPNPAAVDELLGNPETGHVLVSHDEGFTVQHPLREHLGDLFACEVFDQLREQGGPPEPGMYRVVVPSIEGEPLAFVKLDE